MGSQYLLDYYHAGSNVSEFWQPARFNFQGALDYDIHDPWTDSFNNQMVANFRQKIDTKAFSPDGKTDIVTV